MRYRPFRYPLPLGSAFGSEKGGTQKNGTYEKQKSSKSDDFEDFWYAVRDSNPRPSGPEVVSRANRSRFGSDLCYLPPFARRIFHCFRPALPAFFGFWVKSGSDTVRPHPLQQRLVVHRAEGDSKTDLDDLIIRAVQPNTVDLQSRIDLRLSEKVRAENCSDFSHIFQSCGRIGHNVVV